LAASRTVIKVPFEDGLSNSGRRPSYPDFGIVRTMPRAGLSGFFGRLIAFGLVGRGSGAGLVGIIVGC
jgi:hypothetical protein